MELIKNKRNDKLIVYFAGVVKLAYTLALGANAVRFAGSSPASGTSMGLQVVSF